MSEAGNLFALLRQSADPDAARAIEELVRDAPDRTLSRINVIDFARGMCCARAAAASSTPARH